MKRLYKKVVGFFNYENNEEYHMTVKEAFTTNQPYIKLPVWLLTALLPIVVVILGVIINQSVKQTEMCTDLEYAKEDIKNVKIEMADKVGRQEFNKLEMHILRVEEKLDRLIENVR